MNENINKTIGSRIRYYRKIRGLTLVGMADKLHMSKSVISKYERGEIAITVEQLQSIAEVLEIDMLLLLGDDSVREPWYPFDRNMIVHKDYTTLYAYSFSGHDKAYLSTSVLRIGEASAVLYGEVDSEENYQKCLYFYSGTVRSCDSFRRLFMQNPLSEDDLIILDISKPLGHVELQYGFCVSLSTGIYFPLALRWLISEKPIKDRDRLRSLLEMTRDDLREYKRIGAFFVPLKDPRLGN